MINSIVVLSKVRTNLFHHHQNKPIIVNGIDSFVELPVRKICYIKGKDTEYQR